jgi:gp16 family phage-associated protein
MVLYNAPHLVHFYGDVHMKPLNQLTPQEARAQLRRRGETISGWAVAHNFTPRLVYDVLNGRLAGNYGKAHRAAVLLGVKDGEIVNG